MQITEATKLLLIRGDEVGDFTSATVYSVAGLPGLYRRVSRQGRSGLKPGPGNITAIIQYGGDKKLGELRRWREAEEMLRLLLPGVESPNPNQEDDPLRGTDTNDTEPSREGKAKA
jgi:hypothetical protein